MPKRYPLQTRAAAHWPRELSRRVRFRWPFKMFGTIAWVWVFFALYFRVMQHPLAAATVMPLTPLDGWFGVHEWPVVLYASLWFYVGLAPALSGHEVELRAYCLAAGFMSVAGLLFFWLVPTEVPAFAVDWSHYPALQFLKSSDVAGNAFPSLHVAFAVFSAALFEHQLRTIGMPAGWRVVNLLWCLGIVYSTLATRQHVVADVLGGALLAWPVWLMYLKLLPKGHAARQARRWRLRDRTAPTRI